MNVIGIIGGGQSGLAAARAALAHGLVPTVFEAGPEPVGSWPHYYDSLTLFSPAAHSGAPDTPFPGGPEHYPARDEVVEHLRERAKRVEADIRVDTRVTAVDRAGDGTFLVRTGDGHEHPAVGVVAASGSFGNPYLPAIPGQDDFSGRTLHVADYRESTPFAGQRIVVVGGGNSAVQVGIELAGVADVTLASRAPLTFLPQRQRGRDLHYWLERTGFDHLPPEWLAQFVPGTLVLDTGDYRETVTTGRLSRRPMFTAFDGDGVVWPGGEHERVDTVLFATGYRPDLGYLEPLGTLANGLPQHVGGLSTTRPGLAYVGLEFQRSFSSNTLRGVHRDADHVLAALAAHARGAGALLRTARTVPA